MRVLPILSILIIASLRSSARECDSKDFVYEYTNCGENGERWRVAVPSSAGPLSCTGNIPAPQKGLNCSFTCGPGSYLDIETQACRKCAPGTYSLGGGIRFDEFLRLPEGFTVDNLDASQDIVLNSATSETPVNCPTESGWIVRNTELLYVPSPCVSKLSFSAHLVKPGYVEYTYRMPTNSRGLALSVVVKNEQCQSYRDEMRNLLEGLSNTATSKAHDEGSGEWQKKRVELRTGPNVVSWTVTNSREAGIATQPIVMSRIDVVGIAFTRQCTACPEGTYSVLASAECKPCPAGTFSTKGSKVCGKCDMTEYSGPKAARCSRRPACTHNDFYPVTEKCENGKTKRTYKKVSPAVCDEHLPGSAKQPADEPETTCPSCNPGMALSAAGVCSFCQQNEWSDGNGCKRCPPNTQPSYGYHYVWWHSLPPHVESRCEFVSDDAMTTCDIGEAWLPSGDAIVTAPTLQRGIAFEMIISVPEGFHNPLLPRFTQATAQNPIASITIVFDVKCADESCAFYFIEDVLPDSERSFYRFLGAFNGTTPRKVITHPITKPGPARFMVAFIRSGATSGGDSIADQARIFSVNVTNVASKAGVQGGGAASCTPCATGNGGCVACETGKYLDQTTRSCVSCPPRTFSNSSSSRVGKESCIPCGPNLDSNGAECVTSGVISIEKPNNTTRKYDLSSIKGKFFTPSGVRVFAREGTSYFHQFNVSLVGGKAQCSDTYDPSTDQFAPSTETVEGTACRLTVVPVTLKNHTQKLAYISPILVGAQLSAITEDRQWKSWKLTDHSLGYEGPDASSRPLDLHFFFEGTGLPSEACHNGTAFAVTARCDPNEKGIQMKLPPACPDGTCDGCLYQAILESSIACPLCGGSDYKTIKGECVNGHQTIHSIPQKHCVLSGAEASERVVPCSTLSDNLKLLISIGCLLLIALVVVLCMVFRRNQRLEYKYMKLVESKGGGYELPGAESCALGDEEEEEEDRVIFSKSRKGLFGRLRGAGGAAASSSSAAPKEGDRINFATLENDED